MAILMPAKKLMAVRITATGRKLLENIAKSHGIPLSAALEIAIREAAKKRGITAK